MKTNKIIYGSLFIAIKVILERFFSIQTQIVRIGFGFVPAMIAGMFFNPVSAGMISVMSDIIGHSIAPKGEYFIGFTLSAFLAGAIYSLAFYKREITYKNTILAVITKILFVDVCLNTLWLKMMYNKAFIALLYARLTKNLIFIPIEILVFLAIIRALKRSDSFNNAIKEA